MEELSAAEQKKPHHKEKEPHRAALSVDLVLKPQMVTTSQRPQSLSTLHQKV